MQGSRLLVVVAHPDDETFGCGSLLASAAHAGARVTVCCATRGEAGEVHDGVDVSEGLAAVRERELREAGAVLGVCDLVLLDLLDSGMTGDAAPDTLVGAPFEDVVRAVGEVLDRVDPDVVVTLDPVAGDGHRDHVRIGAATTEAVRRRDRGSSLYYWAVPRSALQRWFDVLREQRPDAEHLDLDSAGLGRPDDEITTVLDVSSHAELRRAAIAVHRTQRPPFDDMPPDVAAEFLSTDRLVRVRPPWTGGPVETALSVRAR